MTPVAIRTIIVDDEEPARELLRAFLAEWPDIVVVGEASEGASAVKLLEESCPDLVFLDVQMPGMSGLEVVASLQPGQLPLVVFVTAYDQYALKAFELSACDYLLKPFDARRLGTTVERVVARRREAGSPSAAKSVQELLRLAGVRPTQPLVVKVDGKHVFLDPNDIEWIEAIGKDCRIHLLGSGVAPPALVVRESMQSLEMRLERATFRRVHRSAIVNSRQIREVQPWFRGDYVIILRRGARVVSGRTYRDVVRTLLENRD
jgi:two-component system LytT family response regulator